MGENTSQYQQYVGDMMGGTNFDNRSLADRDSFRAGFSDVDPY
jgi:hypothetical protein